MNRPIRPEGEAQTQNDDQAVVIRTVSMYAEQWAVVNRINERYGFGSLSNALRFIVTEFDRAQSSEVVSQ